jgi:hypothetical protein
MTLYVPNILLSVLLSDTHSPCAPINTSYQVSYSYRHTHAHTVIVAYILILLPVNLKVSKDNHESGAYSVMLYKGMPFKQL